MLSPNYAALLQELWTPGATTTEPQQSETSGSDDGDVFQFLGDQLLWQETIAAQSAEVHPLETVCKRQLSKFQFSRSTIVC